MGLQGMVDYGSYMPTRWIDMIDVDIEKQKKIEKFKETSANDYVDEMWNRMERKKKGG